MRVFVDMSDAISIEGESPPDNPMYLIAFSKNSLK